MFVNKPVCSFPLFSLAADMLQDTPLLTLFSSTYTCINVAALLVLTQNGLSRVGPTDALNEF